MNDTEPTAENPYAAPRGDARALTEPIALPDDFYQIRQRRLSIEESVKQHCLLLVGLMQLMGAVAGVAVFNMAQTGRTPTILEAGLASVLVVAAVLAFVTMWGVLWFAPWARKPLIALAVLALPLFPLGTGLGVDILTKLYGYGEPKFFTREYQAIRQATPELNKRTSFMTWLGVFLLIVLAISIVFISQIPPEFRRTR